MVCGNGGAVSATDALQGAGGALVAVRMSSADDHSKATHLCRAEYEISLTRSPGEAPVWVSFLSTDATWGRRLSVRLDGASGDGMRVLGLVREGGGDGFTAVWQAELTSGKVRLVLLPKGFGTRAGCAGDLRVVAMLSDGVVLQTGCAAATRWLVERAAGGLPRHLWGPDMEWSGDDLSVGRVRRLRVGEAGVALLAPSGVGAATQ